MTDAYRCDKPMVMIVAFIVNLSSLLRDSAVGLASETPRHLPRNLSARFLSASRVENLPLQVEMGRSHTTMTACDV